MNNSKTNVAPTQQTQPPAQNSQTQPTAVESQAPTEGTMVKEATVNETANEFDPKTITVKAGEKVVWMNKSGALGNVSSAMHPTHLLYPRLNLGDVPDGGSVELIFPDPGTYKYHDHLNPTRFGTVVVE